MANVEAGNGDQLLIKSLVESYGMFISQNKAPGSICAIACLEDIYLKFGFHVLDRTLRLCIGTWEGDYHSLSANMLKGIAMMIVAFGDSMKDDLFKEKVGAFSAREIGRIAKERRAGSRGYAESILIAYNKKMKAGLQWPKLYQSQSITLEEDCDTEDEDVMEDTE
jgi:hypothetical protein